LLLHLGLHFELAVDHFHFLIEPLQSPDSIFELLDF